MCLQVGVSSCRRAYAISRKPCSWKVRLIASITRAWMFVSLSTASRFNCLWASGLIQAPTKTFPSRDVLDTFADSLGAAWTGSSGFLRVFVIASPNALLLISVLPLHRLGNGLRIAVVV